MSRLDRSVSKDNRSPSDLSNEESKIVTQQSLGMMTPENERSQKNTTRVSGDSKKFLKNLVQDKNAPFNTKSASSSLDNQKINKAELNIQSVGFLFSPRNEHEKEQSNERSDGS